MRWEGLEQRRHWTCARTTRRHYRSPLHWFQSHRLLHQTESNLLLSAAVRSSWGRCRNRIVRSGEATPMMSPCRSGRARNREEEFRSPCPGYRLLLLLRDSPNCWIECLGSILVGYAGWVSVDWDRPGMLPFVESKSNRTGGCGRREL